MRMATTTCSTATESATPPADNFTLTEEERQAAVALRQACREQGIHYDHDFQIVKYVLLVRSSVADTHPQAAQLRLEAALKRLKKRNAWVQKNQINAIDPVQALQQVEQVCPKFMVNSFATNQQGCVVVAHHHAFTPIKWMSVSRENRAIFMASEQYRLDLAAADLAEARRGVAFATICDGEMTLGRAVQYLRLCASIGNDNLSSMHPHRIKYIYSQVPAFISHLVNPAKRLIPRKVAERIQVLQSMKELRKCMVPAEPEPTAMEWAAQRQAKYQETLEKLKF